MCQPKEEHDIVLGNYLRPGVNVAPLAGGSIGALAVVASSPLVVMNPSQQRNSFAVPAKVIGMQLRPGAVA